ncbi:hypothetical protein ACU6VI_03810 [Sphaerotilus natans]|uniref:hypothetical protein n=1 Tax=Sphaerotilus natans TaxID=34103 RepID=UPI00406D2511
MSTGASGGIPAISHTLYITAGSGNSYKPVQVLAQRGAGTPYGIADIAVFGYTHLAREGGFDLDRHPAVLRWIERVRSQPGHRPVADLLQPLA